MLQNRQVEVIADLAGYILFDGAKQATKYLSEKETIKATRRGKIDRRNRRIEVLLTVGTPNYAECEFIKKAKKAGEPFPIKKVQLKWPKEK